MDDLAGWPFTKARNSLQELYDDGVSHAKALKRAMLQQLRSNESFWRTLRVRDEVLAHIRWSSRILQGDMRVPMPVEWDSRHVVALLEFARVLNHHLGQHQHQLKQHSHPTSSSSSHQDQSTQQHPDHTLLPPVTLGFILANLLIFLKPGGVLLRSVSLSPYCVLDRKEWHRLVTAAFVHVDATHLITNLTAALPEVVLLEEVEGSGPLLVDLALLTLLSHLLYVGAAYLQRSYTLQRSTYYQVVTVGCSGVVFALKVWAGAERGGHVRVWGVRVPSQFAWVPALALTHLCVPEASFPAHLCGVAAGVARAYLLKPLLQLTGAAWASCRRLRGSSGVLQRGHQHQQVGVGQQQHHQQQQVQAQQQQRYVLGGQPGLQLPEWRQQKQQQWQEQQQQQWGGAGSSIALAAAAEAQQRSSSGGSSSSSSWRAFLSGGRDLGIHVGLIVAIAGVYLYSSSRSSTKTSSSWSRSSLLSWRK